MGWINRRATERYASLGVQKPRARTEDLVVEELEDEVLLYDRENTRAHCLGGTAASVWLACDGSTDIDGLASTLDLSRETVVRALEELEACDLLDVQELKVLGGNGNGSGNGLTRRELTMRTAKIGAAVATVPLVYSIAVPSAMAAASPTPFQCELYTAKSCGSPDSIAGCCCCCQAGGSCKKGAPTALCGTTGKGWPGCPASQGGGAGNCSNANGTIPASPTGCCNFGTPADGCGCGFDSGSAGTACNTGSQCGSGCCDTSPTACPTGINCPPCATSTTNANCVPCCNGKPLSAATATFGCCTPGPTSTC